MALPSLSRLAHPVAPTDEPFNLFDTKFNGKGFYTAVYVYAVEPGSGIVRFGLARKVPPLRRKGKTRGAAGTKKKYQGKWVSLGGGSDRASKHPLDAAVRELSDEAYFTEYGPP